MHDHPTLTRLEELASSKRPEPLAFKLSLSGEVIYAVGLITLQWAALYESVLARIIMLRMHLQVPVEVANEKPDLRQESNIRYLRRLGSFAYANGRDNAAAQFDRNITHVFSFKADRDKLAHGIYALNDQPTEGVVGIYRGKAFHLSAKRLNAVAEGISRCHGFLVSFESWIQAPESYALHRSFVERLSGRDR